MDGDLFSNSPETMDIFNGPGEWRQPTRICHYFPVFWKAIKTAIARTASDNGLRPRSFRAPWASGATGRPEGAIDDRGKGARSNRRLGRGVTGVPASSFFGFFSLGLCTHRVGLGQSGTFVIEDQLAGAVPGSVDNGAAKIFQLCGMQAGQSPTGAQVATTCNH